MSFIKLGMCQMSVVDDKKENIEKAIHMLGICKQNMVDIAILPEMFNCPYNNSKFPLYAEEVDSIKSEKEQGINLETVHVTGSETAQSTNSETVQAISNIANDLGIYIVAGSIPEISEGKIYNTSIMFDRSGRIIGKHRKLHMFDIDIPGGITFKESDVLTPGNDITIIDTEFCKIGIGICFDMRFSEQYREMCLRGAKLIVTPAAFNMTTGPAHWETLIRARAIDNQLFHAVVSPARNIEASYVAYGNSMVSDPWGIIIAQADESEQVLFCEIDIDRIDQVRAQLPVLKNVMGV